MQVHGNLGGGLQNCIGSHPQLEHGFPDRNHSTLSCADTVAIWYVKMNVYTLGGRKSVIVQWTAAVHWQQSK